ncbi:hypothetical protein U1Q18_039099 [Sarracenia purpurea var. burkii]
MADCLWVTRKTKKRATGTIAAEEQLSATKKQDGAGRTPELCASDKKVKKALATMVSANAMASEDTDAQLRDPQMGKRFSLQRSTRFKDLAASEVWIAEQQGFR